MERATFASPANSSLIEDYFERWQNDPSSVDASWRIFFEGYELGREPRADASDHLDLDAARAQAAVTRLIDAYREFGHYLADLDPLKLKPRNQTFELLEPAAFGLADADLNRVFLQQASDAGYSTLAELIAILRETYCRTIGVEFMHIRDTAIRKWLLDRMEPTRNRPQLDAKKKRRIIYKLNAAELFETFLAGTLRRSEAVLARGGRDADPAARRRHRASRGIRASARSSWACRTAAG